MVVFWRKRNQMCQPTVEECIIIYNDMYMYIIHVHVHVGSNRVIVYGCILEEKESDVSTHS